MGKSQSPLLGYNNNVRHHGRVFHIQTEDSGVARPHVITHVFADGGRILKTARTSYAEHLDEPDLPAFVKKLMQGQHKAMFIALRDGQFDAMLEVAADPVASAPVPSADVPSADLVEELSPEALGDPLDATLQDPASLEAVPVADERSTLPPGLPAEPVAVQVIPAAWPAPPPRSSLQPARAPGVRPVVQAAPRETIPDPFPPAMLDGSGPSTVPPPTVPVPTAPVPVVPVPMAAVGSVQPPPLPRASRPPPLPVAARAPVSPGRYVAPRPPAGVAPAARLREAPASIFAESLVSERSLDEVILAYLAEELGGTPRT